MRPEVKDILAPDLKELIMRAESPRPDGTGSSPTPSPSPTPGMPSSEDNATAEETPPTPPPQNEEGETNEANNNNLSPADLNGSRDNPTIIEEEDDKL